MDPVVLESTRRRFGLDLPQGVKPIYLAFRRRPRVLAYVAPGFQEKDLTYLAHLALLAELRLRLGVPLAGWEVEPRGPGEIYPDAVWHKGLLQLAVEVDYGYPAAKVQRKVQAYRFRYHGQVWGVTAPARGRMVTALLWPSPGQVVHLDLKEILVPSGSKEEAR